VQSLECVNIDILGDKVYLTLMHDSPHKGTFSLALELVQSIAILEA
jgi:hypothetical protein